MTAHPNGGVPGESIRGVLFQSSEGLFDEPEATIFIGPGFLIENFEVLSPNTARADVTISETALPIDHGLVLETRDFHRMGIFRITDCGPLTCLRPHNPPFGQLELDPLPGAEFPITLLFDDPDGDIVHAEIAIERLLDEEILVESPLQTYRTDLGDPDPESIQLVAPVLPPGDYVALGILGDGLTDYVTIEAPFSILFCPWDLDGDGTVGTNDLILLLGGWGDPYGASDLIELLGAWGPCPEIAVSL